MSSAPTPRPILRLQLFGSRASGIHREDSDIDVLVEGTEDQIESIKGALSEFSIEQGGPLDLFRTDSVDNEIDLVAVFSPPDDPRVILVGDADDLQDILSRTVPISLVDLLSLCQQVDPLWNMKTSSERAQSKMRC